MLSLLATHTQTHTYTTTMRRIKETDGTTAGPRARPFIFLFLVRMPRCADRKALFHSRTRAGGTWHCHWGLQNPQELGTVSRSSRGCDPRNFILLGLQSRYPVFAPGVCRADSNVGWKTSLKLLQTLKPQPRKTKYLKDIPVDSNAQPDTKHSGVL